jgi:hypothetical protein
VNLSATIGLVIMIVSETATLAQIEPFWSWNTPIAWTGFIIFSDSIVWRARGSSWLRTNWREFILLATASIPLWIVFEGYNLVIRNWHYVGLPGNFVLRMFGYAWAFATIWPALFEGAELIGVARRTHDRSLRPAVAAAPARPGLARLRLPRPGRPARTVVPGRPGVAVLSIAAGTLMLVVPFLVPPAIAVYLAAPVWLGFIFLLDPVNAALGGESLMADLRAGSRDRLINLSLSGLLCGALWELWNYWSRAKWIYSVPIMANVKLFEMPLPGYLGFPAFALECFTMYVFVRTVLSLAGWGAAIAPFRPIAL